MFAVAVTILISGLAAWTIPSEAPGTFADGAMFAIFCQGMVFNVVGIIYGIVWAYRNRQTIREMFSDLIND